MKRRVIFSVILVIFCTIFTINALAAELVTERRKLIITVEGTRYLKLVENFVVVADVGRSMMANFGNTTRIDAQREILLERNNFIPDGLKFNSALYVMSPWRELHAPGPYDTRRFAQAISQLPTSTNTRGMSTGGDSNLGLALRTLRTRVMPNLEGSTVVVLITDGKFTPQTVGTGTARRELNVPADQARFLFNQYPDISLLIVSTAEPGSREHQQLRRIASLNAFSRMVPFNQLMNRPGYIGGVLFDIVHTRKTFLRTVDIVTGLNLANVRFGFAEDQFGPNYRAELNALGRFLRSNPQTFVELSGFTCNIGPQEYNIGLSRRRAERVRDYLKSNFGLGNDRFVLNWYGPFHPVASNATTSGRAENRRVSVELRGL